MKIKNGIKFIENDLEAVDYIIKQSEYTKKELLNDYKKTRCNSWKKGFWASRGIGYKDGFYITQVLGLDD